MAQAFPYDLVLMDLHMPELDGFEATRRIRQLGGTVGRVPVIALTADVQAGVPEQCRAAGMDGFLEKPIRRAKLKACLEYWSSRRLAWETPPASSNGCGDPIDGGRDRLADLVAAVGHDTVADAIDLLEMEGGGQIARLEAALACGDTGQTRFEAHALKSAAGALGLTEVQNLAAAIESAARLDDPSQPAASARSCLTCSSRRS